jgi:large subunit ribosomal protein L18
MNKQQARNRRGLKTKAIIRNSKRPRLTVYRSGAHIYSQIVLPGDLGDQVIVSASTLDKEIKPTLTGNKCEQANQVGKLLAQRAKEKELLDVAFDRAGYRYHGRVKALADGAREAGLNF